MIAALQYFTVLVATESAKNHDDALPSFHDSLIHSMESTEYSVRSCMLVYH